MVLYVHSAQNFMPGSQATALAIRSMASHMPRHSLMLAWPIYCPLKN